jgi:hypothetical protein
MNKRRAQQHSWAIAASVLLCGCSIGPLHPPAPPRPQAEDAQARADAEATAPVGALGRGASQRTLAATVPWPAPGVASAPSAQAAPAAPAAATASAQDLPAERTRELQQVLQAWQQAWQRRDAAGYLRAYDPQYKGAAPSRQRWEQQRRKLLAGPPITVAISEVHWDLLSDTEAEVRFLQHYQAGNYRDVGDKKLRLRRTDGGWRITQESWQARRAR